MKRSWRLWSILCGVVAVLWVLTLVALTAPCDEDCHSDVPACNCVCICCGQNLTAPARDELPVMAVEQYIIRLESAQYTFSLVTDIFRPPIA